VAAELDLSGHTSPATRTLLPLYCAHGMVHVLLGVYPAILLILHDDFGADFATLGAVFTAATFLYGVGSVPTGFIVNRVHPLTIVRCYLGLAVVAAAIVAVAPGTTAFAIGLLLLGLAASPYHTAAMTLISRASGNSPKLLAHHGMAGSLGLAVAPLFAALLAATVSWRLPYAVAAGVTVLVLAGTWAMPRMENPSAGTPEPRTSATHGETHLGALALVYVITMALGFVFRGVATYLPALATERAAVLPGSSLVVGGFLASLVYAVGFFGQWSASRLGRHREIEGIYALLLGAQALLLTLVVPLAGWDLVVLLLVYSIAHFTCQPLENVLTGKYTSLRRRGVGFGFSFGLSFGMGSFAAWAGGAVVDARGGQVQYAFLLFAGAALVAAVCGGALWLLARRLREAPLPAAQAGATPDAAAVAEPEAAAVAEPGAEGADDGAEALDRPFPDVPGR